MVKCPIKGEKYIASDEFVQEKYDSNPLEICDLPPQKRYMGEFDKHSIAAAVARVPKELFFQYNPSCIDKPGEKVLPLAFRKWRDEETAYNYSFLTNEELSKKWTLFKKMLPGSEKPLLRIPTASNFHIVHYHVVYVEPTEICRRRQKVRY